MNIDDYTKSESEYITKDDLPQPVKVKIAGASLIDLDNEQKVVLFFVGKQKGLVCNKTNLRILAASFADSETDHWLGKEIVVYNDPSVMYAGKVVGGVRVKVEVKVPETPAEGFDDDVPF